MSGVVVMGTDCLFGLMEAGWLALQKAFVRWALEWEGNRIPVGVVALCISWLEHGVVGFVLEFEYT